MAVGPPGSSVPDPAPAAAVSRRGFRLSPVPGQHHDDRGHRRARIEPADLLSWTVLAWSRRLLRRRRLYRGDPDGPARLSLLGDPARGGGRLLHRGLSVRPAGAQAGGPFSRACDLRAGARRAADPEIQVAGGPDRRRT